jgi:hypothetical protein
MRDLPVTLPQPQRDSPEHSIYMTRISAVVTLLNPRVLRTRALMMSIILIIMPVTALYRH